MPFPPCADSTSSAIFFVRVTVPAVAAAIRPAVPTNGIIEDANVLNAPAAPPSPLLTRFERLPDKTATASVLISFFPIHATREATNELSPVICPIFIARNAFPRKEAIFPAVPLSSRPLKIPANPLISSLAAVLSKVPHGICPRNSPIPLPKS